MAEKIEGTVDYRAVVAETQPDLADEIKIRRRLTRKLDFVLLPTIFLLDMISILERANIGNARIQGLEKDLHMDPKSNEFNTVLSCTWGTYIPAAIVGNVIMKKVAPSSYLSCLGILSGIMCMCQGFVQNYHSLVACRLLLGLFTGGISAGTTFLMSAYYSRWELQRRYSIVWTNGFVAGAFGGLFAYALSKLDGVSSLAGWRWIFIIEGLLAAVVGILAKFTLLDWPTTTSKLEVAEKLCLANKMAVSCETAKMDRLDRQAVKGVLGDWKIYLGAGLFLAITVSSSSVLYFMPTILKEYGYSASQSQLHTIPVYVVSAVFTLGAGFLTDWLRRRAIFVMIGSFITIIGYTLLLCQANLARDIKYLAVIIAAAGIFTAQPITVVWTLTNQSGQYKRAISMSILLGCGNIGSIIASNIFMTKEAPTFRTGFVVALVFVVVEISLCLILVFLLKRENRRRDEGKRDHRWHLPDREVDNLDDDRPDFRFSY